VTGREQLLTRLGRLASIAFATGSALALFVFVRFVYDGLSGQRRFSTWPAIVAHYLLPAGAAIVLFASIKLRPIPKLRLLLTCVAATVSVYAVELFLVTSTDSQLTFVPSIDDQFGLKPVMARLASSRNKSKYAAELARQFGSRVDIRTPQQVIADFRNDGVDAVPIVTATNHLLASQPDGSVRSIINVDGREVIPLGSVASRVTLLCNENGLWVHYPSDSRGFNNPDKVWQAVHVDVAALGDSFTQGYCVSGGKSFVDLIRQNDDATVNLGMAGDGPLMMLATLKEYLPRLSPNVVLWFYYEGNDLTDLQTERRSAVLRNYLKPEFSQRDLARQTDIDRAILAEMPRLSAIDEKNVRRSTSTWNRVIYSVIAFVKLTALRARLTLDDEDPSSIALAADFEQPNMAAFREILSLAKSRVEGWNGQLLFVYLPEWARYTRYSSWGKAKRGEVLELVRSLGISIIDIDPVFQAHGDPLSLFPFRGYGHYTEAGHRLVAEEVLRRIPSPGRAEPH
jgi:hypothetical protein